MGTVGGKRAELINISEKQVTREDVAWPCYLEVQDTVGKMAIKLIKAQMVQDSLLNSVLYSAVQYGCNIILFTASLHISQQSRWCVVWYTTEPELKLHIT